PGIGMDEHGLHPKRIRDQAGMLAPCPAEALQCEARRIVAFLHRDLLDRVGHVGDSDAEISLRNLTWRTPLAGGLGYFLGQISKFLRHDIRIKRLIAFRTEDRRKMPRLDLADTDIGIGHSQRAATAIAGGPRFGTGRIRPDTESRTVEMKD